MEHLCQYPNFAFRSARIAAQLNISQGRAAWILREMYEQGYLDRRCRTKGNTLICSYRIKKTLLKEESVLEF
jgi:Mn-dependent DtxR family transcriptional regulator